MSKFFEGYYEARGVRFLRMAAVKEFRGDGVVNSAVLESGQTVPCEMVVAGIGCGRLLNCSTAVELKYRMES